MVSFNSNICEGCDRCSDSCVRTDQVNDYSSESSFVDVMKREGLTDDGIFTACSYERYYTSGTNFWGWNGGKSYDTAESTQKDCVMEKFVAKLGQAN